MIIGQLDIHIAKVNLNPYLISDITIDSKQIKDLNVNLNIIKLLAENLREPR